MKCDCGMTPCMCTDTAAKGGPAGVLQPKATSGAAVPPTGVYGTK